MNATNTTAFDDLDDLDAATPAAEDAALEEAAKAVYVDKCPACRGTGMYRGLSRHGSRCFKCDGRGTLTFATSPEQRAKGRASAAKGKAKKESEKQEAVAQFAVDHPRIVAWWNDSTFEFAISLRDALQQWGRLTDNQLAAAYRSVDKLDAVKAERAAQQAQALEAAPEISIGRIEEAFATAMARGIKKPKLRLSAFKFSPAPATGRNAGAIYVVDKDSDQYLGKVFAGKFVKVRECSDEQEKDVLLVASDPAAAAIAYGRRTGCCSICGRELTKGESIDRGIGPICAEKFGF